MEKDMVFYKLWILTSFFVQVSAVAEISKNPIERWQLDSKDVVLGRNVNISCIVKTNTCQTTKWNYIEDGKQSKLLMFDNSSQEGNKYSQFTTSRSFTLVIQNITERELNGNYMCVCNFSSRTGQIPKDKVVVIPKPNEVRTSITTRPSNTLNIFIGIDRINPIPVCSCSLGENTLPLKMVKEENGLHYQVHWSLTYIMTDRERCALLTVQCKMPSTISNHLWKGINEQNRNTNCKGNSGSKSSARVEGMWMVLAVILYILSY